MKKKIVFSTKCEWVQLSMCSYTNCIEQFQTQLYHDWRKFDTTCMELDLLWVSQTGNLGKNDQS